MTAENPNHLRITRRFDASPERVFDAWIDPQTARKWLFGSLESHPDRRVEIDARVGGSWLMTNRWEGQELEGIGEYLEIDRPRRLAFTFAIPQFGPHFDRIVVEIVTDGTGCVLTLTHELLPPDYHSATESGWGKMFDLLAATLAS
ncbi:MAG: SRPBCC domain-containing protein [Isosphaerales bacterium]